MSDSVNNDMLRSFVERIERLDEETKALSADKSEVYRNAKGNGFDVKVLKEVIRLRRKDPNERAEFESLVDLYKRALGMLRDDDGTGHANIETARGRARTQTPKLAELVAGITDENRHAEYPNGESATGTFGVGPQVRNSVTAPRHEDFPDIPAKLDRRNTRVA